MTRFRIHIGSPVAVFLLLAILLSAGCAEKEKFLKIDPPSFDIDANSQTVKATIEASASWMSYSATEWLRTYPDESQPGILIIEIPEDQPNMSLEPREGEITIITGDAQTATIPIRQKAMEVSLTVTPDTPLNAKGSEQTLTSLTVECINLTDWEYSTTAKDSPDDEWLQIERNENTLDVTIPRSHQLTERRDTIFIRPTDSGFETISDTIPVYQSAAWLVLVNDAMTGETVSAEPQAATVEYTLASLADWTASADNGASITSQSGSADTQGTALTVSIPENTIQSEVTYTLTFSCGGETYTYYIIQSAAQNAYYNILPR